MNVKHPIHHTELANIAREQARIRRLIHAGARIPALSPEGVVDSVAKLFEQIEYLESQLHIKAAELATQLAAATKRADDAESERDVITAKCEVLLKLNGDLNKNNDHVIAAHESLRLELGLEVRESFEDAIRAIVSQRDTALAVLKDLEWAGDENTVYCHSCAREKKEGHSRTCALAACLNGGAE